MSNLISVINNLQDKLPLGIKQNIKLIPRLMLSPFSKLPASIQELFVEQIINAIFRQSIEDEELHFLENKWLAINITDAEYRCFISLTINESAKLVAKKSITNEPSVEFSATTEALALLMNKQEDPDTLFFKRALMVTGDTELGLEIKNFLDDLEMNHVPQIIRHALDHFCKYLAH